MVILSLDAQRHRRPVTVRGEAQIQAPPLHTREGRSRVGLDDAQMRHPSESVAEEKLALDQGGPSSLGNMGGGAVDINSGGAVFFCVFDGGANEGETVAVVKFCANRLAAQSEYFAYEIANSLGVVAPTTRLFRKAAGRGVENTPPAAMGDVPGAPVPPADGREWSAALDAARRLSFPVRRPNRSKPLLPKPLLPKPLPPKPSARMPTPRRRSRGAWRATRLV